jgi:hypothetical protein
MEEIPRWFRDYNGLTGKNRREITAERCFLIVPPARSITFDRDKPRRSD